METVRDIGMQFVVLQKTTIYKSFPKKSGESSQNIQSKVQFLKNYFNWEYRY